MNKLMKSILVMVPAVALVGGLSTSAMADNDGWGKRGDKAENCDHGDRGDKKGKRGDKMRGGDMGGERMVKMMSKKLDLTDAQEAEMTELMERQGDVKEGHQAATGAMYDELAKLEVGTDTYNAQVDKIAEAHASMMAAGMKVRAQMQADIMNILNDDQKAEYQEMLDKLKDRMGGKSKGGFFNHSH